MKLVKPSSGSNIKSIRLAVRFQQGIVFKGDPVCPIEQKEKTPEGKDAKDTGEGGPAGHFGRLEQTAPEINRENQHEASEQFVVGHLAVHFGQSRSIFQPDKSVSPVKKL